MQSGTGQKWRNTGEPWRQSLQLFCGWRGRTSCGYCHLVHVYQHPYHQPQPFASSSLGGYLLPPMPPANLSTKLAIPRPTLPVSHHRRAPNSNAFDMEVCVRVCHPLHCVCMVSKMLGAVSSFFQVLIQGLLASETAFMQRRDQGAGSWWEKKAVTFGESLASFERMLSDCRRFNDKSF